jgi:hypothetical protein
MQKNLTTPSIPFIPSPTYTLYSAFSLLRTIHYLCTLFLSTKNSTPCTVFRQRTARTEPNIQAILFPRISMLRTASLSAWDEYSRNSTLVYLDMYAGTAFLSTRNSSPSTSFIFTATSHYSQHPSLLGTVCHVPHSSLLGTVCPVHRLSLPGTVRHVQHSSFIETF